MRALNLALDHWYLWVIAMLLLLIGLQGFEDRDLRAKVAVCNAYCDALEGYGYSCGGNLKP
jgi:hypothetical protein